jgi:Uma2 family endonuclease
MESFDRSIAMTFTKPILPTIEPEIDYPDDNGEPLSDNTEQFRLIVLIKENLEMLYASDLNVFIAGDLLWYPIEGDNKTRLAPDAMVIFGRPKGKRGSYMQWKEKNIAPKIAFEILSPRNFAPEMEAKRTFYETYGIEEYYSFDPDRLRLKGWIRQGDRLIMIPVMQDWVSPRMGIRFAQVDGELELYHPDGRRFVNAVEMQAQILAAQRRSTQAENKMQQMILNLLRSGMTAEQVAEIAGCSIEDVTAIQD